MSEVSVAGDTAVLTLAQAIPSTADVSVVYEAPSANPLQSEFGAPAESFAEWDVTVLTPDTAPVFSSASVTGTSLSIHFNELLDESSAPAGSAFTVKATRDGRTRTIGGTGTVRIRSATYVKLASAVAAGETVTLSYDKPSADPLRDRGGTPMESFSGMPVTNGKPRIQSVAIVSDPTGGDGDTYGRGDTIRVQVTFDVPVRLNTRGGVPRLKLDLVPGTYRNRYDEKWAVYESGANTDTLTFAWTVTSIVATAGIAVPANAIDLNGGRIIAFSSYGLPAVEADLEHAGLDRDPDHKVDSRITTPPAEAFWSATLTVHQASTVNIYGCFAAQPCSEELTDDTFTVEGTSYQVTEIADFRLPNNVYLSITLDKAILSDWTLHVGDREFPVADATHSPGGTTARWDNPGLNWQVGDKVSLSLTAPAEAGGDEGPAFQSASVTGASLTLTFDEDLDAGSVPAHGDFYVTVAGARRNVAAGGVAIDGAAVTLTLASAVARGEEVRLRYSKGANPLRDEAGNEVESFAFTDRTVTNNSPPAEAFWSATLTVAPSINRKHLWLLCGPTMQRGTDRRHLHSGGHKLSGHRNR